MSIVSPWGFGVNRAEIQQLVRELVLVATDLPPETVYITDTAARVPMPPRSLVSIHLGSAVRALRTGNDERIWPSTEQWLITINSVVVASNPQRITILGVDYDYTATGVDTPTTVRDGLLAAIGVPPTEFTAVAVGADQIQIDSTVDGLRLDVRIGDGNDFTRQQVRGNAYTRNLRRYELQCNIRCKGLMSIEAPNTTQSGQSIADLVDMAFSSRLMTEKMRDCGHVPIRIPRSSSQAPVDEQQVSEGLVQVIIATTGRFDVNITSVTEAPMQPNAIQQ